MSESAVLSTEEAAEYINRTVNFVRRTLRYEVPVVQYGTRGKLYFFRHDLDRWLAAHTQVPAQ